MTRGSVRLDGVDLVSRPSWERARAGLFLALQQPIEVPGVRLTPVMAEALAGRPGVARTTTRSGAGCAPRPRPSGSTSGSSTAR